jgi:hypothetical protein
MCVCWGGGSPSSSQYDLAIPLVIMSQVSRGEGLYQGKNITQLIDVATCTLFTEQLAGPLQSVHY